MSHLTDYSPGLPTLPECRWQESTAECHGFVTGLCCRGVSLYNWWQQLPSWHAETELIEEHALLDWAGAIQHSLDDALFSFALQLEAEETLMAQATAMAEWCQGFLLGIQGEQGQSTRPAQDEVNEAIDDILQCSRMQLAELDEDDPDQQADLLDLLEHVRVCVLTIYQAWNAPHTEGVTCH